MNRQVRVGLTVGTILAVGLIGTSVVGHWCSNIYDTYARIVVKAERTTLNIASGQQGTLKVYVRNNFPYTLEYFEIVPRPTGLTVTVAPTRITPFYPGQNATYTLTIKNNSADANGDALKLLNLNANTKVGDVGFNASWWKMNPTAAEITARNWQTGALNDYLRFMLSVGDGLQGLTDASGLLRSNGAYTPQEGANNFRALEQLGVLLRFKLQGASRTTAVTHVTGLVSGGKTDLAKGFAAFVAAYGGNDAGVKAAIEAQASAAGDLGGMAKAGLYMLGDNAQKPAVQTCAGSAGNDAKMLCRAALAIMGDDTYAQQITSAVGKAIGSYSDIFYMNVLQLTVFARRGGPDGSSVVSFLTEESPGPNPLMPKPPTGVTVQVQ